MINRYSHPELRHIWSDSNKYKIWLKIELLAMKAFVKLGKIPEEDYIKAKNNAKFSITRIHEIEETTKHDVIAFTRAVSESLGDEKKWIHYGLTSSDIVDTGFSCMVYQSNEIIHKSIYNLLETLRKYAIKYKLLYCIGRTHGMHAEITTYGYKFAVWYESMNRAFKNFIDARNVIEAGIMSGAVGNYANIDPFVQEYVCAQLNINSSTISTQILQRDRHAIYMSSLSIVSSVIEQIAVEIRHLQRTEVGELEEAFSAGQKGSSAMPHKRNPIGSENLTGISRVLRGYALTSFENIALWHERDISHSSTERIIFPDATSLLHYQLERMNKILKNLSFNKVNIQNNLNKSHGLIYSQRVLLKLIDLKGWSREKAYDTIQPIAAESYKSKEPFRSLLEKSPKIKLSKEELDDCFSNEAYLENIDFVYKRIGIM